MKNNLKKFFFTLIIFTSFFIISSLPLNIVHAADSVCDSNAAESVKEAAGCNGSDNLVADIIVNILYIVIFIVGIISAIYIVIGGVKYMSSKGDANATQTAKKTILYSLIGLVITSLAFIIVNFSIGLIYGNGSEPGESGNGGSSQSGNSGNSGNSGGRQNSNNVVLQVSMIGHKSITTGSSEKLQARITPMWASNPTLTWNSSDPSIVSVDDKGNITAIKEGIATITAESDNGKSATTKITVTKSIEPEKIVLSPSTLNLTKGETSKITSTVIPSNASHKNLTWSSKNKSIATVNSRGQVTAKKEGNTTITVKTDNGKTATVTVKVANAKKNDGPAKIDNGLLNNLTTYYQTNHVNDSVNVKGKENCGKNYGRSSCGASAYLAAYYTLTRDKAKYSTFIENVCKSGLSIPLSIPSLAPGGAQQQYFVKRYHVRLNSISRSWDASVSELEKGHPIIYMVNHPEFSPYGPHYVAGLSYDKDKKKIFIWNPNQGTKDCKKSNCWYSKSNFEDYVTGATNLPTQTSGVWSMKKTSYWK